MQKEERECDERRRRRARGDSHCRDSEGHDARVLEGRARGRRESCARSEGRHRLEGAAQRRRLEVAGRFGAELHGTGRVGHRARSAQRHRAGSASEGRGRRADPGRDLRFGSEGQVVRELRCDGQSRGRCACRRADGQAAGRQGQRARAALSRGLCQHYEPRRGLFGGDRQIPWSQSRVRQSLRRSHDRERTRRQ